MEMNERVVIETGGVSLEGQLVVPDDASGLVIFSHGSGSSRFSPRNNFVAQHLQKKGLATFLFDLLTKEEDMRYGNRFNVEFLSDRLVAATEYLKKNPKLKNIRTGYFGASTGAASAIVAASGLPHKIHAIVSRGGRPDMALNQLYSIEIPTLLIVGELDTEVITLNRIAYEKLPGVKSMHIVKGASHLFDEPGTLEDVAGLASDWFIRYLTGKDPVKEFRQAVNI